MTSAVRIGVILLAIARTTHADCPVSSGDAYTYADETGTKVSLDGSSPIHVKGQLAAQGEVYAGVGLGFTDSDAPFDASKYRGIAFKAKRGPTGSPHVRVKLPDGNTDPKGGVCTECYNDFGLSFQVTEEWVRYEVPFEQLKQEGGWGKPNPPSVDKAKLYGLQWQTTTPGAELDLYIDGVEIVGCNAPAAVANVEVSESEHGLGGDNRPRNSSGEDTEGFALSFHGYLRLPVRVGIGSDALRRTETRKSTSSSVNRTGSAGWLIETPFVVGETPDGQVSSKLA